MKNNKVNILIELFHNLYKHNPDIISSAPGRAEIIGNHTDYNQGYALSAAISHNTYTLIRKRKDTVVRVYSEHFVDQPLHINLNNLQKTEENDWLNYIKAVLKEFIVQHMGIDGMDILISSVVPFGAGVSSSAALEVSLSTAINGLWKLNMTPLEIALLSQQAENGPLVNSPCGFLDQASSALCKKDHLLFLDFLPKKNTPVSKINHIPFPKDSKYSFMVCIDPNVKRQLGTSGYPARRKMCEASLPHLSNILDKKVNSLRDISVEEFKKCKKPLNDSDPVMRKRVEHVVYENQRVLDSVTALKNNNTELFGKLLTESGKSALDLYELAEKTPELRFLVEEGRKIDGVVGIRNMGGGFSANILALVEHKYIDNVKKIISERYFDTFRSTINFIKFNPSQGACILYP